MPTRKTPAKDELVSFMAKQLLQGATMIAESCPECETPLLRYKDGTLFCAKCQRPVIIMDTTKETPAKTAGPPRTQGAPSRPAPTPKPRTVIHDTPDAAAAVLSRLEAILLEKILETADTLRGIRNPKDYPGLLEVAEDLLRVYQQVKAARWTGETTR